MKLLVLTVILVLVSLSSSTSVRVASLATKNDSASMQQQQQRRTFCSSLKPDSCVTVFTGNYTFETAGDVCSSFDGEAMDMRNETMLDEVSSILSESGYNHSLIVNARRSTYLKRVRGRKITIEAHVLKKGYIKWYSEKEDWSQKHRPLCKYKVCPKHGQCVFDWAISYNFFAARGKCLSQGADLIDNVEEAKASGILNRYDTYWLGINNFYWAWINSSGGVLGIIEKPRWSIQRPEDASTECASVAVSRCQDSPCLEWQARDCNKMAEMSVVCQFAGSLELSFTSNPTAIGKASFIVVLGVIFLHVIMAIVVLFLIILKSRSCKRRADVQSNKQKKQKTNCPSSSGVGLNYPDLTIMAPRESTEIPVYETCDGDDYVPPDETEHTYTNFATGQSSVYSLSRGFNGQTSTSSPSVASPSRSTTSPMAVIDNVLYDEAQELKRKGPSLKSLAAFVRKTLASKRSCDSDTGGSASSYEPLSPVSFGRRSENFAAVGGCQAGVYCREMMSLNEMNNYARLSQTTSPIYESTQDA